MPHISATARVTADRAQDDEEPVPMSKSPKVLVAKAKDAREVDLASRLLLDRIVYLGQEIDSAFTNSIVQQFLCLRTALPQRHRQGRNHQIARHSLRHR